MKEMMKYYTIFAIISFATAAIITRPKYIDCIDSLECGVGTCCTVGLGKYSVPKCQPILERGETCRPDSQVSTNLTLTYPDGITVNLTGIYVTKCPCDQGYDCSRESGVCEDPYEEFKYNALGLGHENDV